MTRGLERMNTQTERPWREGKGRETKKKREGERKGGERVEKEARASQLFVNFPAGELIKMSHMLYGRLVRPCRGIHEIQSSIRFTASFERRVYRSAVGRSGAGGDEWFTRQNLEWNDATVAGDISLEKANSESVRYQESTRREKRSKQYSKRKSNVPRRARLVQ